MSGVISAIGFVVGANATRKAAKAQENMAKEQQKQQELSAMQSRRQAVREAQIRRAQTVSTSQAMGVVGSSGVSGGTASLGSQLGGSLGFASQMSGLSANITKFGNQANNQSALANLGFTTMQASQDIAKMFGAK
jgi:hypothetical protein